MNKGITIIFKTFMVLLAVIGVVLSVYLAKIMTLDKGTVKEVAYNLKDSEIKLMGDGVTKSQVTNYDAEETAYLQYETEIRNLRTESLNTKVKEIVKGQDYYLYFTLDFKPVNKSFEITPENLGTITSDSWEYYPRIPKGKSESDYERVVKAGEKVSLEFYVKTNEPIEKLGFYLSKNIDEESSRHYLSLKEKDPKDKDLSSEDDTK